MNWLQVERIKDLYREGFTIEELVIMYWDLPAFKIIRCVRWLKQVERV